MGVRSCRTGVERPSEGRHVNWKRWSWRAVATTPVYGFRRDEPHAHPWAITAGRPYGVWVSSLVVTHKP